MTARGRGRWAGWILLGAILSAPAGSRAADAAPPDMATDRPDQTESTSIVTPGRWQIETGYTHAETGASGVVTSGDVLPETLLRIGLVADRLELRLIHGGWGGERARPGGSLGSGLNDGALGVKVGLLKERGGRPEVSLNAHVGLPIGAAGRTSGRYDPDFRFLMAHSLPNDLALSYNLGAAWSPAAAIEYTLSLAVPLGDALGGFVEAFGDAPVSGVEGAHSVDGGVTYGLMPNLQLDLAGGAGLTPAAEDWFAGVGVSYRYPD